MIITGIGSRNTPPHILKEMTLFGEWCRENKIWIRSGHAEGADWAFEKGAQERCIVYLPWQGFNKHLKSSARLALPFFNENDRKLATKFHPKFNSLSESVQKLMMRNGYQVLGRELDRPSDLVICWTPMPESGGTTQALRIARANNIPVVNMNRDDVYIASELIHIITFLKNENRIPLHNQEEWEQARVEIEWKSIKDLTKK